MPWGTNVTGFKDFNDSHDKINEIPKSFKEIFGINR
jgi:hypothetical protein